jgi:hypothetical protein
MSSINAASLISRGSSGRKIALMQITSPTNPMMYGEINFTGRTKGGMTTKTMKKISQALKQR